MGFDGSSFNIITGSFINDISASTVEPSDFEVGVIALDPDNSDSFLISSSRAFGDQQTIIYFSGSGPIGIGTTDPKNEVDIKTNSFKIRSRDGSEETEIISGRLITKKFYKLFGFFLIRKWP